MRSALQNSAIERIQFEWQWQSPQSYRALSVCNSRTNRANMIHERRTNTNKHNIMCYNVQCALCKCKNHILCVRNNEKCYSDPNSNSTEKKKWEKGKMGENIFDWALALRTIIVWLFYSDFFFHSPQFMLFRSSSFMFTHLTLNVLLSTKRKYISIAVCMWVCVCK